ncbi:hypothetical protein, partial [Spirosoma fluminis]
CLSATNQYSVSGTVSLTNAVASSLTITDGSVSQVVSVSGGQSSVIFSLTGLSLGTGSHTLSASGQGYSPTSLTYTAPASCSVPPTMTIAVTQVECSTVTNECALSGTMALTNAKAGILVVTDGQFSTTVVVADGQTSASFSLTGLIKGTGNRTITATGAAYGPASTTYVAPAADIAPCIQPVFTARAIQAGCLNNAPQANALIILADFNPAYIYQYSEGAVFNPEASLSGAATAIPVNGVIASNLANPAAPKQYTVRVYSTATCFTDVTVRLTPTVCGCPTTACIPYVVKQIKRGLHRNEPATPSPGVPGIGGR